MFNKIILMGRICHDLELKTTPNGISVLSFRIAVDRNYQVKGEERKADFFSVVAWRSTAEFISKYFSKGRMIMVNGELQTRQYVDKNGVTQNIVEIVADTVHFTGEKAPQNNNGGGYNNNNGGGYNNTNNGGGGNYSSYNSGGSSGGYNSGNAGSYSSGGGGYTNSQGSSYNSGFSGSYQAAGPILPHPAETANTAPETISSGTSADFGGNAAGSGNDDDYPF